MVVTGDLNVARGEADLKNWKGNLRKAGFLVGERARLDARLTDAWVGRASAYAARWSDHAPVVVDYDV
jgi:exodeoxyribonuclease-3